MSEQPEPAIREIVSSTTILQTKLSEGWKFDPWLCARGSPITIGDYGFYWVLIKGTPEEIIKLNPLIELPKQEEPEIIQKPIGYATIYIDHSKDPPVIPEGYVILHKDHIYSKGTVYTKIDAPGTVYPNP